MSRRTAWQCALDLGTASSRSGTKMSKKRPLATADPNSLIINLKRKNKTKKSKTTSSYEKNKERKSKSEKKDERQTLVRFQILDTTTMFIVWLKNRLLLRFLQCDFQLFS